MELCFATKIKRCCLFKHRTKLDFTMKQPSLMIYPKKYKNNVLHKVDFGSVVEGGQIGIGSFFTGPHRST